MSKWRECKLGDIATVHGGKRLPKGEMLTTIPTPHPYIRITDFQGHKIRWDAVNYVEPKIQKAIARYTVDADDLVISIVGTLGLCAIIPKELAKANLTENCAKIHIHDTDVDKQFLYYHLISSDTQDTIASFDVGSTQPKLPLYNIQNIPLSLPPLPEQRAIAAVLSSLDDKIDLLHRQNKTLESLASALWQKMFIEDADPKWTKATLADFGDLKNGINYSREENGDAEYSIVNVRDIVESKYLNPKTLEKVNIDKTKATPYLLQYGDIVIVRSASPGESFCVLDKVSDLIYSGFSIRLRCHDVKHFLYVFQFLLGYKKEMDMFSDGTTLKNINQEILNSIELPKPDDTRILAYNDEVKNIYTKIVHNQQQVRDLAHMRELLLPKLMSGEIAEI